MTAFTHFRRQRHRWMVLCTVVLLLFNQVALARHLCVNAASAQPLSAPVTAPPCHDSRMGMGENHAGMEQIACGAHCGDVAKQAGDTAPLSFPALPGSQIAQLQPLLASRIPLRPVEPMLRSSLRRPNALCIWLI